MIASNQSPELVCPAADTDPSTDQSDGSSSPLGGRGRKGHFRRYNAFIENGWLAVLGKAEQSLWHAYEKHADPDGLAYPDGMTLAILIGHRNTNNLPRVRASLVRFGLLEILEPGGGRDRRCLVRVLVPPKAPAQRPKHSQPKSVCGAGETLSNRTVKHSQIARETLSNRTAPYKDEHPNEHPMNSIDGGGMPRRGCDAKEDPGEMTSADRPASASRPPSEQKPEHGPSDRTPRDQGNWLAEAGHTPSERSRAGHQRSPDSKSNHQALIDYFVDHWAARWGATYPFGVAGAKNGKHVKSILQSCKGDIASAKRCVDAFFACSESFFVESKHGLGLLVSQIHKFISGPSRPAAAPGRVVIHNF